MENKEKDDKKWFKQGGGFCFRWCFQWVSCNIRNVTFNLNQIKKNAETIIQADQNNYLIEADSVRNNPRLTYGKWVSSARACDRRYIDIWGARYTKKLECKNSSGVSSFDDYFNANGTGNHIIICIYGEEKVELGEGKKTILKGKSDYWGHAMAFAPTPMFFDPNTGEWVFDAIENIGHSIDEYCDKYYVGGPSDARISNKYVCVIGNS